MTGWGQKHSDSLEAAIKSTGLNLSQVKNWIRRRNMKRKAEEMEMTDNVQRPLKKACSPWQQYLKQFAKEKAGEHDGAATIT
jgi:hypothetical protein